MAWYEIVLGVLLMITAVVITVFVLMQKTDTEGLSGAIVGGSSDSFYGKNKGRTKDAQLAKITKVLSVIFFILVLGTTLILAVTR